MVKLKIGRLRAGDSPAERSLAEQLQINDREIRSRKELLDFVKQDEDILSALKVKIVGNLDRIVDIFYERQLQSREISLLIGDAETLQRLRGSMRRYIIELFEGYYDAEYVNKRLRIGKVHQRIGVSPKLYVSALSLLQTVIIDFLRQSATDRKSRDLVERQQTALRKLLMFDMQFIFDTYISTLLAEVDTARIEMEEYAEGLEATISRRTEQLRELSTKDSLTGLFNQRGFYEHLRRELAVAERNSEAISLVYFDLNGLKKLNDSKGHKEGDRILAHVGESILAAVRNVDFGCRYGGDEFCVVMPRTELEKAEAVHARTLSRFDKMDTSGVKISAGIIQAGPEKFTELDMLVKDADSLMYKAKARARKKPGHYVETGGKGPHAAKGNRKRTAAG